MAAAHELDQLRQRQRAAIARVRQLMAKRQTDHPEFEARVIDCVDWLEQIIDGDQRALPFELSKGART